MDETPFGRYRLRNLIGEGGMGQVYQAFDTVTDRMVALKVLPEKAAADDEFRERFRREAHAVAGLRDPHVVPIHDYGEIDGRLFLDMRIIDGTDVESLLREQGPLSPRFAVSIIEQVASALDAAHENGLVHRDVKPSNMLVTPKNFVYLIDFGIARAAGDMALTSTGIAIGTLTYMAPERFTSGHADARSDVYALACVLHECVTGARPFPGKSLEQQVAGHLNTPPPQPSQVRPGVPPAFDDVVARGMAKDPNDRYSSAGELAAAAYRALMTVPGPMLPPPPLPPDEEPTAPIDETRTSARRTVAPLPSTVQANRRTAETEIAPRYAPLPQPLARPKLTRRWVLVAALTGIVILIGGLAAWKLGGGDNENQQSVPPKTIGPASIIAADIPVGRVPVAIAIDPANHALYTADSADNTVSVIDANTRTVTATIPVGENPVGLAVDPVGRRVFTANINDRTISVIDTGTSKVTKTIQTAATVSRVTFDPTTQTVFGSNPDDNTVTVIDPAAGTVIETVAVGDHPWGLTADTGTHAVYVTNSNASTVSVIDTGSRTVTGTIQVGDGPARIVVDSAARKAYTTLESNNTVSVIDLAASTFTSIPVGRNPVGIALDVDIHTLYVANIDDSTISVIDTATGSVTGRIEARNGVSGLAVDPATHVVYATNEGANTVSVIVPAP